MYFDASNIIEVLLCCTDKDKKYIYNKEEEEGFMMPVSQKILPSLKMVL